jgi:aminoglycoside phosphotransferase (APT) family kinase protein
VAVSLLKKRSKTAIYKIDGVGPDGSSVAAKLCRKHVAAHERKIYEQILPSVPVSYPLYYGSVQESDTHDWLFLEYIEGEQYSRSREDHSILVGKWLGLLHSTAAQVTAAAQFPDRGPQYHLIRLQEARNNLKHSLKLLKLPAAELAVIDDVISQCDLVESRWSHVEQWCACLPCTLVHGDFKPRNVVIRTCETESSVFVFDWETSGWGVPTADLAYADITSYHKAARRHWPDVSIEDVRIMKTAGRIFRGIEEFRWESEKLDPRWEASTIKLNYYCERMVEAIQMAQW